MSAFADITDAVRDKLLEAPALAGGRVWRGRIKPLAAEHSTAIVVRILQAPAQAMLVGGPVQWESLIAVDCMARAAVGVDPEDAVDPLLADVYARLITAGRISAGVMDTGANPAIEWDFGDADTAFATATLTLRVAHQTQPDSLAAWT